MPIWKGAITARRFRISEGAPNREEGWRDRLRSQIEGLAFRHPQRPVPGEEVWGFVLPDNMLETDFSDNNRWLAEPYVILGLRLDRTFLPKEKILAETKRRTAAWIRENGVERCPNAVRRTIKEQVEEELRGEARTKSNITDIVWNLDQGYVLVGSTTTKVMDEVRKRFLHAFGVKLVPMGPLREGDLPRTLGFTGPDEVPPDTTLQFLSWVHFVSEEQDGVEASENDEDDFDNRALFVTDRVSFMSEHSTVQIKGELAGSRHEAGTAVKDGRLVSEVKVDLQNGGQSTAVCILTGELPDCKGLKFVNSGDDAPGTTDGDARVVRMLLYEAFYAELVAWAKRFVSIRTNRTAWDDVLTRRAAWAAKVAVAEDEAV
jgi:hypothetical protein